MSDAEEHQQVNRAAVCETISYGFSSGGMDDSNHIVLVRQPSNSRCPPHSSPGTLPTACVTLASLTLALIAACTSWHPSCWPRVWQDVCFQFRRRALAASDVADVAGAESGD